MTLLGNKYNYIDDEEQGNEGYTIPAVVQKNSEDEGVTFKKALVYSTILHPATVALIWFLVVILGFLGITFSVFNKPDMNKKKDIEFVLVDKAAVPRDIHTRNRADVNSRSGGKRNKKMKVSMPSPKSSAHKSSQATELEKMIKKQQKQIIKQQRKVIKQQRQVYKQVSKSQSKRAMSSHYNRPATSRPAPPSFAPSPRPMSAPPKVALHQTSPFAIPVPSGLPMGKSLSTGPVGGTGARSGAKYGGSTGGGNGHGKYSYAPSPSLAPSRSTGSGQFSRGYGSGGSGHGSYGNPGGGGGRPGIDAIREPDFGPYMRELQRRIKMNWNPPKGNESKRVVLLFKIAKNGRMLSCRVLKSSGLDSADNAALRAVELTAPFRPLPGEFRGQNIDIQFTFDYNVFGATRR